MYKVGLTGNFYSGYGDVADAFEMKGVPVFDSDLVLKFMINYSESTIEKMKSKFGTSIYRQGLLDMKRFESESEMERLLDYLQLDLMKSYEKWRVKHLNKPYTIFKSSILFEKDLNQSMNFVITTYRPKVDRRKDIQSLTHLPYSKISDILDNEMDEDKKNEKSDYVIHNYFRFSKGGVNFLNQVDRVHDLITSKSNMMCDDLIGFA